MECRNSCDLEPRPGYGAVVEDHVHGIEAGSNKIGPPTIGDHPFLLRELQHEWVGGTITGRRRVRSPGAARSARQPRGNGILNYQEANVQAQNKDGDGIGTFAEPSLDAGFRISFSEETQTLIKDA
jgi:hypothetical protein